ncbi:hypothetical protein FKR81_12910 [Lentzea tibetensis]|uniref:Uncharacterized protein n=1 Tax=Lentzea tibetensis TaxID=2591470 RepID=A0A563EVN1_9PSEU|nr:hypothetical protein [Lentzea tibetensis]TWP51760.1 hypothetical protein FKR81_12910 [Lentzea tibetensis]
MNSKPEPTERRRHRIAALLIAAAPVATALALAAPLTVTIGAATTPHPGATLIPTECVVSVHSGALNTMKVPVCAGD